MRNKFSYFDFICYFIPGTLVVWSVIAVAKKMGVAEAIGTFNSITDTLVFVILSFIAGHLVQARSKDGLEEKMKHLYWGGHFASEIFLVKGNKLCLEADRARFIKWAETRLGFLPSELELLEADTEAARSLSHSIYKKAYSYVNNNKIEERASTANTYYNFFRGLSSASFFSGIAFALCLFLLILDSHSLGSWAANRTTMMFSLILVIILFYARKVFRDRAKQRGELHVQQVFNSAYTFRPGGDKDDKQG